MIQYAILGLLHYKDMHGYRIKEHIEQNFGFMWSVNYGQIYPGLKKLSDNGWIAIKKIEQNGDKGPPRKLYAITDEGREAFAEWLASDPEKTMLLRDPFLMRFVFYGFGDSQRATELIDEQIKKYEALLDRRESNLTRWEKSGTYVRLISELGVELNNVFLNWLKRAREEIQTEAASGKSLADRSAGKKRATG